MERAARADWTSHDPINSLGLFGMGFNIATARLGSRTTIWTTQSGTSVWFGLEIDFNQLMKQQEFISAGIPQIKPTFLDIAPSGIPSNIIPHSKGVKCGLIRSNSPFSYSNHRPAKPKIPKPLVYAQVSPLGTSFATP